MKYEELTFSVDYDTMTRMENAVRIMMKIGYIKAKAQRRVAFNYMNRLSFDNTFDNPRFDMLEKHR